MPATQQHDLNLGESVVIKRTFMTQTSLLYAGMPSPETVSFVVIRTARPLGMAYNLYLPTNQRQLTIEKTPITLHSASPTTVLLSIDA